MAWFAILTLQWFNQLISVLFGMHRTNSISCFTPSPCDLHYDKQGHLLCKCIGLRIDSADVGRCPFAHFYVYIHSSTYRWLLSVEGPIRLCIDAYLRICVYLFSTVNCILVIQGDEHSLFIFRSRPILTKKYLVKFCAWCLRVSSRAKLLKN